MRFACTLFCLLILGKSFAQDVPQTVLEFEAYLNTAATPGIFEADRLAARYQANKLLLRDSMTIAVFYDLPSTQVVRIYNDLDMVEGWPEDAVPVIVEITSAEVCMVEQVDPMGTGKYLMRTSCTVWNKNKKGEMPEISRTAIIPSPVVPEIVLGNMQMQLRPRFAVKPIPKELRDLPTLDWPPPLSTVQGELPARYFGPINKEQHASRLESVLATYGYLATWRYRIPGQDGLAIVTAPERMHADGSSYLESRFVQFSPGHTFSLARITESLRFFAKPGTYRVWLLAIQQIRPRDYIVTPYVYLFEVPEPSSSDRDPEVQLIFGHRLNMEAHLEKSGWIRLLRGY